MFQLARQVVAGSVKALTSVAFPRQDRMALDLRLPRTNYNYNRAVGDGRRSDLVTSSIRWLQRTFPEAPPKLEQLVGDDWENLPTHPMLGMLENPNPAYSGIDLMMAAMADLIVSGEAYILKLRTRRGAVQELWWTPSVLMCPKGDGKTFITHYEYQPDPSLEPFKIDPGDVIHLRFGFNEQDPRRGRSQVQDVLREVFSDLEASNYTASLLRNLGVPGVIISPTASDVELGEDEAERLKLHYQQKFGGDRRGEPLVLGTPSHVTVLSFSPEQMNLRDLRRVPEERVTAALGVPAMLVGFGAGLERSTFTNVAEAREFVYENTVLPLQRLVAAQLKRQLLVEWVATDALVSYRFSFDHTKVRVLAEDQQRLSQRMRVDVLAGYRMVAEARKALGLPVRESDWVYLRNMGTVEVPVDTIRPLPEPGTGVQEPSDGGNQDGGSGANVRPLRDPEAAAN